jgi:hypothetical protein
MPGFFYPPTRFAYPALPGSPSPGVNFSTFPGKITARTLFDIAQLFGQEAFRQRLRLGPVEAAFLGQVATPGALFGAAETAAKARAAELFAPRGEVASLIDRARGQVIGQGFAPEAAVGAENAILAQALKQVGQTFAQQAGALEQQRFAGLTSAFGEAEQGYRDLLESLYTGVAGAGQFQTANKGFFKRLFGG